MDTTSIEVAGLRVLAWADRRLQEKSTIAGIAGWLATIGFASVGGEITSHADTITALAGMLSTALVTTSTKPRQHELLLAPTIPNPPALPAPAAPNPLAPEALADPAKASPVTSMENNVMTSVSTILVEVEADALAVLKAAGKEVKTFVLTEGQKLVAEVKQTYVGTVAMNVVSALESQTMSGADKLATVVTAVTPLIEKLVAAGGISGAIASVESFAIEFAQSVYNDFKADAAVLAKQAA